MRNSILAFGVIGMVALAVGAQGSGPRVWTQAVYDDFAAGKAEGVTIDSEGTLTLAPATQLRFDTGTPRIWAITGDGVGNLYVAVGEEGKVFRVDPSGNRTVFFESEELGAQALAWGPDEHLYVATGPDGAIYRLPASHDGSAVEPWHRPEPVYVWDLEFDADGRLLVATGDPGRILRISDDGSATVVFEGQAHVRSLLFDGETLYAGTADDGLVLKVGVDGDVVVLHEADEAEVTSLAIVQGSLMVGTFGGGAPAAAAGDGVAGASGGAAGVSGGVAGAIYRVHDDGYAERLWSSSTEGVHALAAAGTAVVAGTGPSGLLVRVDPDGGVSRLGKLEAAQVVALVPGTQGGLVAATSNLAKVYTVPDAFAARGTFRSQVKDTGAASRWGVIRWRAVLPAGTGVELFTRSGNTSSPDDTWSDWRGPYADADESAIDSPAARFVQWRADLFSNDPGTSPVLHRVEIAYLPRNLAPKISKFRVHPGGVVYRQNAAFEDGLPFAQLPQSVAAQLRELDPNGGAAVAAGRGFLGRPLYVPGLRTLTWEAADANGDPMVFDLQLRGEDEVAWKPLAQRLGESIYTFETGRVPDGVYLAKLVATDAPGNPAGTEERADAVSRPFVVDNTAPVISGLGVTLSGGSALVRGSVADATSLINGLEYSVDGGTWQVALLRDGTADSSREAIELLIDDLAAGEHTVIVRVSDTALNRAAGKVVFVVP